MLVFVFILLAVIGWWVGAFLLFLQQKKRRLARRLKWIITKGNVTYAKIKHFPAESGGDNVKEEEWTVRVEYSYSAAGKTYLGGQDWSQNSQPYGYVSGSDITIYYNPKRHKENAVIIDEIDPWWIGGFLFAAAIILPIVLFILIVSLN
jgi:hypothetical protein